LPPVTVIIVGPLENIIVKGIGRGHIIEGKRHGCAEVVLEIDPFLLGGCNLYLLRRTINNKNHSPVCFPPWFIGGKEKVRKENPVIIYLDQFTCPVCVAGFIYPEIIDSQFLVG
jgi:hypothetical protein